MWAQLFSPSDTLKLFPPHFIMRDILLEQVEKTHKSGQMCVFFYFDVKKFSEICNAYPKALKALIPAVKSTFSRMVKGLIDEQDLLLVQQYYDDDFIVAIRRRADQLSYEDLYEWANLLRKQAEFQVNRELASWLREKVTFHAAFAIVDPGMEDTFEAVRRAIEEAKAVAKQHIQVKSSNVHTEMRRIIKEEAIHVLAQPIISFETGTIRGWEILTRGPKNTPYALPADLFHYAFQTENLVALEIIVFKKALIEIEKKNTTTPIFINVTVPALLSHQYYQAVLNLLQQYPRIPAEQIVLEITERHSIDNFHLLTECINNFRKAGFKFAVDDTGAGYASLHAISEILPDVIKIDRSIIQDIDRNEVKNSVLQALLLIAAKIGSEVVAEGIETEAEANLLLAKNVNLGQGYFFSKPQEPFPEVAENWVVKQRERLDGQIGIR